MAVKGTPGGPALVAGRLSPEKGVDIAIRAIGRLPGARLDVAGTGAEEDRLRRLADSVAPGRVRFLGLVPKSGVHDLMLGASVVAVPSRWYENQPMVVLEALARGVPVVGSNLGGLPELVQPGLTGELVPPGDPGALAAALEPFLSTPDHGWAMRERARERIGSEFSPERHLERLTELYAEAGAPLARAAA
jgi:glycosyltransferase involved in cell wall biosynthesis